MDKTTRDILGVDENKPNDWFENLYSVSNKEGDGVPWANMKTHPTFQHWIDNNILEGNGKTALVVGCGMGDDAVELESHGFKVTAFDVSKSAIALCEKRFPNSKVDFVQADLLEGVSGWYKKFDFVLEIFTIQALPPKYEKLLMQHISDFVSEKGKLMVITEVQSEKRIFEKGPPWLLNSNYIESFESLELKNIVNLKSKDTHLGDEIHLSIFQRGV